MESDRPRCGCHDEPMHKNGIEPTGTQKWRCAQRNCEHYAHHYQVMSGLQYNRKLLYDRRRKALLRVARRAES